MRVCLKTFRNREIMSAATFDVYAQIDAIVDKMATDMRAKLRKAIERNDKIFAKQIAAAQKTTQSRVPSTDTRPSSRAPVAPSAPTKPKRRNVRYDSESESDGSR
jgi:hypothetical protein